MWYIGSLEAKGLVFSTERYEIIKWEITAYWLIYRKVIHLYKLVI